MIVLEIIYNLALLVAISVIAGFIDIRWAHKLFSRQVLQGFLFGLTAMIGILKPFELTQGIIFDGRSVVISICALFYGPVGGGIAASVALITRLAVGGGGIYMGSSVIIASFLVGWVFHIRHSQGKRQIWLKDLALMGVIVHVIMIALMTLLPQASRQDTFRTVAFTVIIAYPLATVLMGSIIKNHSEIQQLLKQLSEKETKYRLLVENQSDMLVKVSSDGKFLYASPSYCKMFGKSEESLIGNSFLPLVHEDDRESTLVAMQNLRKPPYECYVEQRAMTIHGWKWIAWADKAILSKEGIVTAILGIGRDITEIQEARLALKESEEKFRTVAETTTSAIFIFKNEHFIYVNPYSEYVTGYTPEEMIQLRFFDIVHPDHREMVKERGMARQRGEKVPSKYEFRIIHKNGETRWVSYSGSSIRFGGEMAAIGTAVDITPLKQSIEQLEGARDQLNLQNEELQTLNEELEETLENIQVLNKELVSARKKAEESDRLKSAFLANMSHELRTPMNGIIGFADLLTAPGYSKADRENFTRMIVSNADQLMELISDIIDLSKIEAGFMNLNMKSILLRPFLEEVVESFRPRAAEKGLILRMGFPWIDLPEQFYTDPVRLKQILNNLLSNAIKYTETGTVETGAEINSGMIRFYVKDTGSGIAPELTDKIFDRFFQVIEHQTGSRSGTGLGLSIARSLVNQMNGKIWVESIPGQGSLFCFTLPLSKGADQNDTVSFFAADKFQLNNRTILVVEDDETNLLLLKAILEPTQAQLICASNGQEAINLVNARNAIDLIIMDLRMPVLNGLEATRILREQKHNIPILAQTAYAFGQDKDKAITSGCNDFISKPFRREEFLERIYRLLNP